MCSLLNVLKRAYPYGIWIGQVIRHYWQERGKRRHTASLHPMQRTRRREEKRMALEVDMRERLGDEWW